MKLKLLFLLLFSIWSFGQNRPLEIKIINIISQDTLKYYKRYQVNYELKNYSDQDVLFFNATDNPLQLNYRNTSVLYANFDVYDQSIKLNKELFISNTFLLRYKHYIISSEGKSESEQAKYKDSLKVLFNITRDTSRLFKRVDSLQLSRIKIISSHNDFDYIKNSLQTLKPNQAMQGKLLFYWYKKRYRKIENDEFYLDDTPKSIKLTMLITDKKDMKRYFTTEEFKNIEANPNFIKGEIVSNTMEIIFK